ncbi:hypothetical protein COV56_00925 [Candidatus Kuenenbacteria bacterium CG11_big_fil_rev_8_21_14_0_20_37_9]|nr:MAG: hypothetical protein COV56_00925 [Candidatus Kuenenbacteria bacterium CG11_big_fil_rev_8_21_14_0_20_37_9]
MESNYATILKGSKNLLCAHGWTGQTQLSSWRRISQSEIRNSAVEKSESESEGGQKFLPTLKRHTVRSVIATNSDIF